jgi:4-hydroxy-3-methylbut-2-enyl diphosphate reductase
LNSQNIQLAKYAGFCYGVKRAVETAKKLKIENPDKNIYVLGELIHNMDVIQELDQLGIKTIYEIPKEGEGICIVRSHGEAPEVFEKLELAGFEVVDMTCLDVKKVQQRAIELAKNDYFVIIVGKLNHPEVIAIRANAERYSDKVIVATSIEEISAFENKIKEHQKVGVVVQTTQMLSTLNTIVSYLNSISKEVRASR